MSPLGNGHRPRDGEASSLWQRLLGFLRGEQGVERPDVVAAGLVLGLRDAALGLAGVERTIEEAETARSAEDFTQARLFTAAARLVKRCADSLTEGVSEEEGTMEQWRSDGAATLYRAVLELSERAQAAIASPPGEAQAVTITSIGAGFGMPREAGTVELLELGRRLGDEYAADIALARAERSGDGHPRLEELLAQLQTRTNLSESLLGQGLAGVDAGTDGAARTAFDAVLLTWTLIVQELVRANITAGLQPGPGRALTRDYSPDNVWLMTDPVAKAVYERQGKLQELEQDVRFSALRGQPFSADDIAYAQQIDRLEQASVVKRMASYYAVSPHPPIYRALHAGQLFLAGRTQRFRKGDDIVWLCQMEMEMLGADAPVFIGQLAAAPTRRMCGDMGNSAMGAQAEHHGH